MYCDVWGGPQLLPLHHDMLMNKVNFGRSKEKVSNRNTTRTPVKQSLIQRLGSILVSVKLVFSQWTYITLAGTIAAIFWIIFNVYEQLLFFYPIVVFYLLEDAITGFIFSNITAILLGMVVSEYLYA